MIVLEHVQLAVAVFIANTCNAALVTMAAEPPWRTEQVSPHVIRNYSDSQLDALCKQNDYSRIEHFLDNILVPRTVGSEGHKKVALFIRFSLEELNYRVEFFPFTQRTVSGVKNFTNIVATRHPHAARRLVLACHYDSKDYGDSVFLGATDSALPCSLLLDVAASLNASMPSKPKQDLSLQLIFFDGEEAFKFWSEEDSLYGSKHLAELWTNQRYSTNGFDDVKELDRIDVLILLDLLGSVDTRIGNYPFINDQSTYALFHDTEKRLSSIPGCLASSDALFRSVNNYFRVEDDHLPFVRQGVKVVHLISWPFPTVWHSQADDRSALDKNTIENLAAVIRAFTVQYLNL